MVTTAVTHARRRWREAVSRLDRARGAKALVAYGTSFGLVTAWAGVHNGIFAAMGCYIDAYGARDPYPRRGPLLAVLSAGFAAAFLAGSLAAGTVWAMAGVLSVFAAVATLFVRTLHLSGPGSYFVVLVAALTAFLPPAGLADTASRTGFLLFGAALSWATAMSGRLVAPHAPEERAVATALRAVADFARSTAGNGGAPDRTAAAQRRAYGAVHAAWSSVADARGRAAGPPPPRLLTLYALALRSENVLDAVSEAAQRPDRPVPAAWPAALREAAAAVRSGRDPVRRPDARESGYAPPPCPEDVCALSPGLLRAARDLWPRPLPPRTGPGTELRRLLSLSSPAPAVALRVGLAVAAGTALGTVLPVLHPAWVAVGAAAALQGADRRPPRRAAARLTGTVAGAGVTAVACHLHEPGLWATVATATVVHAVSRAVPAGALFTRMLLNTPVALLLVGAVLPPGRSLEELALYRMLDLALGLTVGLAAAVSVPGVPARAVSAAVSEAVAAAGAAVCERLRGGGADARAEGLAWQRAAVLWDMYASVPAEEIRPTGTADRLWPTLLTVRRLLPPRPPGTGPARPDPGGGALAGAYLRHLADAARQGLPGSPPLRSVTARPPAALAVRHPELYDRLEALGRALRGDALTSPAAPGG
ncbi:FUSC family protein [Streptomyces griseoviridis]|uniref:Integral membrane bound transporter domain-containing protein n=1 Tax=Streptomyces griseoviridis TaxID=45398 RepID=A0A918LGI1_STRGD|nr:FUSC family protein [Streptomyces niveoruber]GGS43581.1 hypothetical protein GCM10010238_36630 [Streptomyces niveoruber]